MNLFGVDKSAMGCSWASVCTNYRSPTPIQHNVYHLLLRAQRRTLWIGIVMLLMFLFSILALGKTAFAGSPNRDREIEMVADHQSEQDRNMDRMEKHVERIDQRQTDDEQQLNRILGFGGGLAAIAIFLQVVSLFNQRQTGNQILEVVQTKEGKASRTGGGL